MIGLILLSFVASTLAQTPSSTYSAPLPTFTPNTIIPRVDIAPLSFVIDLIGATTGSAALDALKQSQPVRRRALSEGRFGGRPSVNCIGSNYTQRHINSLFSHGGVNTTFNLCPGATIKIYLSIQFSAAGQTLITLGAPTNSSRALSKFNSLICDNARD
jgi:hypothetical protein